MQNFRAKPEIPMATCEEPDTADLARTVAVARLILGPDVNVQVPPNLSPEGLAFLLDSGINDLGGVAAHAGLREPEAPVAAPRGTRPRLQAAPATASPSACRSIRVRGRPEFLDEQLRERVDAARATIDARNAEGTAA